MMILELQDRNVPDLGVPAQVLYLQGVVERILRKR